jgi:Fe-S cluster assembly protein SufD
MIDLRHSQSPFAAQFQAGQTRNQPRWLRRIRSDAWEHFAARGFPTTHDEEWKYTNVAPIAATPFLPAPAAAAELTSPLAEIAFSARLVFVNGRYSEALSSPAGHPAVAAAPLARLLAAGEGAPEAHLARSARFDRQPFVALNTALADDGAVVEIKAGAVVQAPLLIVHLAAPDARPTASHPRNLIVAGRASQASVVELYLGPAGASYLTNAVTEIVAQEGAILDHYTIQAEGDGAFHISTVQAVEDRSSVLRSHNFSLGAALARNDINSVLDGEGAECVLNGLYIAGGNQHVDNHTALDHAKPNCPSHELYKGILGGRANGVFNGKIIVRQDAQKTNAIQGNRNLLLSAEAAINTKPQLEIYADDVRCTHGATVGQLDADSHFYMRSRGIPAEAARSLLIQAFAEEVLDEVRWQPLGRRLRSELRRKIAQLHEAGARS